MSEPAKGHLVGVFGPFGSRALVEVPSAIAEELIGGELVEPTPAFMLDAVAREVNELRERSADVADSALGALARALAYELANPYNSATSKAACARELREALDRLRELAPPRKESDGVDDLAVARAERRAAAGRTDTAAQSRT